MEKIIPDFNPLSANLAKWSDTLNQFAGNLPTNFLSAFDHFLGLALKGLIILNWGYRAYSMFQ